MRSLSPLPRTIAVEAGRFRSSRRKFTISETRTFLSGFSQATTPAARWRALAERKLAELEAQSQRIERMKSLLESSFHCGCLRIEDCERAIAACDAARKPLT